MKNLSEFHDGLFNGLWITGKTVHIFLSTSAGGQHVLVAEGVAALRSDGVKAGNVIFEVLERGPDEIALQDIQSLYDLQPGSRGEAQGAQLRERACAERELILEINPSYGATVMLLASSLSLWKREEWVSQVFPKAVDVAMRSA